MDHVALVSHDSQPELLFHLANQWGWCMHSLVTIIYTLAGVFLTLRRDRAKAYAFILAAGVVLVMTTSALSRTISAAKSWNLSALPAA